MIKIRAAGYGATITGRRPHATQLPSERMIFMPYRVEFRGGPRNAEIEEYASTAEVPNEIAMDYVDANLQGSKPLSRVGHYRRDGANPYLLWHVDHRRGEGTPLDIDTPEDGFEAHTRPRETRAAGRAGR